MLKILQLSDTHYTRNCNDERLDIVLNNIESLENRIESLITQEDISTFDCVVINGDLVHEGDKIDYNNFHSIIERYFSTLPIFYTLGNHDLNEAFCVGIKKTRAIDPFDYLVEINNYDLIFLDSTVVDSNIGELTNSQLNWLEQHLNSNIRQKIIFQHHPIIGDKRFFKSFIINSQDQINVISGKNIIGVFSGHTHSSSITVTGDFIQYTCPSFSFSIDYLHDGSRSFNNKCGYTVIEIDDKQVVYSERYIEPKYTSLKFG